MGKPILLIVDDSRDTQEACRLFFEDRGVEVLQAYSLTDARSFLGRVNEISAILWDGELKDGKSHEGLIQEFASVFKGPMIAASRNYRLRTEQMKAGCHVHPEKEGSINYLCRIMGWSY